MAAVKLNQEISIDGRVTTLADELAAGRAYVTIYQNFGKHMVKKYVCELIAPDGSDNGYFEINAYAYRARAAIGQNVKPQKSIVQAAKQTIGDFIKKAKWDNETESFECIIPASERGELRAVANVLSSEPVDKNCHEFIVNFIPFEEMRHVELPDGKNHEGIYKISVNLYWRCPVCGQPRGEKFRARSYDGSQFLICDGWRNPCGHIDKYIAVIDEAITNGLNPELQRINQ